MIPDKVDTSRKDAVVYMNDVYTGGGLNGVPRGTVKRLRLFAFDYGYQRLANHTYIGIEGPWDVHRIVGTVKVESDGSASFRVPANTPLAVQPLDEEGKALQLMRSWMTVMPGETRSCVGCHEDSTGVPPAAIRETIAGLRPPVRITPWYGRTRGFSFDREVQPVLDKYCVSCHDGSTAEDGSVASDLSGDQNVLWAYRHGNPELIRFENRTLAELAKQYSGLFSPSYIALRKQMTTLGCGEGLVAKLEVFLQFGFRLSRFEDEESGTAAGMKHPLKQSPGIGQEAVQQILA